MFLYLVKPMNDFWLISLLYVLFDKDHIAFLHIHYMTILFSSHAVHLSNVKCRAAGSGGAIAPPYFRVGRIFWASNTKLKRKVEEAQKRLAQAEREERASEVDSEMGVENSGDTFGSKGSQNSSDRTSSDERI